MVRVVRLERTVSWSQTRRDTNFAIPGCSFFCHYITARRKIKVFSVCGHSCGQSCFCAVFCNRGKSSKRRCRKALRRFASPCPGYRHGTPKSSALPTGPHPDACRALYTICRENATRKCMILIRYAFCGRAAERRFHCTGRCRSHIREKPQGVCRWRHSQSRNVPTQPV